ncbi:GtrA family protein [Bosea sp. (in: a-proteobacteria)]|uniref:GtrA family protein n=1 Tax=Bosea sp. (in: a-proteobacteria) TaxID=1871050 RepID=UPI003B3BBCF9
MSQSRSLIARFGQFLGVGALGFLVDAGVFALALETTGLGPLISRLLAFAAAATFTWVLNRRFTFGDRTSQRKAAEFGRYALASLTAGGANLLAYWSIIHFFGTARPIPYVALAAGVGVGLAINFLLYSVAVFRKKG